MSQGACVAAFMGSNGPQDITNFNWNKYRTPDNHSVYFRIQHQVEAGGKYQKHSYDDIVTLTKEGERLRLKSPDTMLCKLEVACTGEGNCMRVCGEIGPDRCGCRNAQDKRHACCATVQIFRTAQDIFDGNVRISRQQQHVAPETEMLPPPLDRLRADASNTRQMVRDVTEGGTPASVLSKHRASLSSDSNHTLNTRYAPKKSSLESKARYVVRKQNLSVGGEMSGWNDWQQTNNFIKTTLIQKGIVLYFQELPGSDGIVVIAENWALLMLRKYGGKLLSTDAKKDTTLHCKSMFSSIRCFTPSGSVGAIVWIAEVEDGNSIKTALDAVARNVPCNDADCEHKTVSKWLQLPSGQRLYMQGLSCFPDFGRNPDFCPFMVHDKHVPTFDAVFQSHFRGSLLDGWHAHKAVSEHVTKVVGVSKEAAHELDWAVRLYRRSLSDEQVRATAKICVVRACVLACLHAFFYARACGTHARVRVSQRRETAFIVCHF